MPEDTERKPSSPSEVAKDRETEANREPQNKPVDRPREGTQTGGAPDRKED